MHVPFYTLNTLHCIWRIIKPNTYRQHKLSVVENMWPLSFTYRSTCYDITKKVSFTIKPTDNIENSQTPYKHMQSLFNMQLKGSPILLSDINKRVDFHTHFSFSHAFLILWPLYWINQTKLMNKIYQKYVKS